MEESAVIAEKGVGAADAALPGRRGRANGAKIGEQLPETGNNMTAKGGNKGTARGLAFTQAAVHDASPPLHGCQSTKANNSPGLWMLASGRDTEPHSRPRQHRNTREVADKKGNHGSSDRAGPEMVKAVRGEGVTGTRKGAVLAGSSGKAVIHEPPKHFLHTVIPTQAPELGEKGWKPRDSMLH